MKGTRTDVASLLRSEPFLLACATLAATLFAFWPYLSAIPGKWWFADDTYYAHGAIIPFCTAFIVYSRWDRIKDTPVRGFWPALVLLIPVLYLTWVASRTVMWFVTSMCFLAALCLGTWFVAGGRWLMRLGPAILYLAFCLPLWRVVIDQFTPRLQWISSTGAYAMLKLLGLGPWREQANVIQLPNYTLNVAEPCSGLKLTLAVVAICVFFMLVAHLRWWGNLTLAVLAVPISMAVNSLRIGMIGIVGNTWGEHAGQSFHDTSGYIGLVVCFFILYWLTKKLGWK